MVLSLESVLKGLTVFPYETETMDFLTDACKAYSSKISLAEFEGSLLYLCQGRSYENLISAIEEETGKSFPNRVYRGLAGYIVSLTMEDENLSKQKKVLFSLMVRNVIRYAFDIQQIHLRSCRGNYQSSTITQRLSNCSSNTSASSCNKSRSPCQINI